jgi:hypothetical protein
MLLEQQQLSCLGRLRPYSQLMDWNVWSKHSTLLCPTISDRGKGFITLEPKELAYLGRLQPHSQILDLAENS